MKSIFVLTALLAASRVASSLPFLTYGNEKYDYKDSERIDFDNYEHGVRVLKMGVGFQKAE